MFCGITFFATLDTDEISTSFERNGGEGSTAGENAYEPPVPLPSPGVHADAHPDDVSISVEGCPGSSPIAYGTFHDTNNSGEGPWVSNSSPHSKSVDADFKEGDDHPCSPIIIPHSHLLPVTTIDADID